MKTLLPCCFLLLSLLLSCVGKSALPETREIQTHLDLAERRMIMGNLRQALDEIHTIREEASRVPRYHYDLGMIFLGLNKTGEAELHLEQAVKLKADYGEAWNNLGLVRQLREKPHAAIRAFQQALSLPNYATPELAAYNLAKIYQEQDQPDLAIRQALRAMQHNRDFIPGLLLLGDLYSKAGQPKKALSFLQQAVKKDPENTAAAMRLAEALVISGQKNEALPWLKFVLKKGKKEEREQAGQRLREIKTE